MFQNYASKKSKHKIFFWQNFFLTKKIFVQDFFTKIFFDQEFFSTKDFFRPKEIFDQKLFSTKFFSYTSQIIKELTLFPFSDQTFVQHFIIQHFPQITGIQYNTIYTGGLFDNSDFCYIEDAS